MQHVPSVPGTGPKSLALSAVAAALLLWSVSTHAVDAPAAPASAASAPGHPAVDASAPKPFAEVIKGATREDGLFPIWRKEDKVWLEIPVALLDKPFLFTVNIANSVGERGLYASQMGGGDMAVFRRVGHQMQLIALNTKFRALGDEGAKWAVEQGFSPSLIAGTPVASAESSEHKSVLIDASFLLGDIPAYATALESAYRLSFSPDRANSYFDATRADAGISTLTARVHFYTPHIPLPPLVPSPMPMPTPPQATPDPRSLFVSFVYSLKALPAEPMAPRLADPRLGHFTDSFTDLGHDNKANTRVHYIKRWRLEKKDPDAALSEPVTPIVYWLDKNIPPKYRPAVEAGILEWNKAFEKIGFKNAIVVKQQPDDADWDDMDASHASIRWFVGADVGFAIGPNVSDPRSGEIMDADIGMSDVFSRGAKTFVREDAPPPPAIWSRHDDEEDCTYAQDSASEMSFALDLMEARGEIIPGSPEAEAFANAYIKAVITHEVGHTLGLKHNFKASTVLTQAQLDDKVYTEAHGISGSVMDYVPFNIATEGEPQGSLNNTTIGPYDYWAIEYAYKPIPKDQETAELARIAARSTEPDLAYGDDLDAGVGGPYDGMDPAISRFDLGDDPLAFFKKRLKLSQELWARVQARKPEAGDDPLRQRRAIAYGFAQLGRSSADLVGKYVGGMTVLRDLPGSTARAAFTPVDPTKQRAALQFLATGIFSADAFRFRPEFLTSLTVDYDEFGTRDPFSVPAAVLQIQMGALDRLMSVGTAHRLLDLPYFVPEKQRKGMISLNEVYGTLQAAIWSELKSGGEIDRLRRDLQRQHLRRVEALLTHGSPTLPPDALSLVRMHATELQAQLRAAVAKSGGLSPETRAHLQDCLGSLTESLRATMLRS